METRVHKYKEYRESILNGGEIYNDKSDRFSLRHKKRDTSTILPMDEVIEKLVIDDDIVKRRKKAKRNFILKNVAIALGVIAIIAVFVIVGINLFK